MVAEKTACVGGLLLAMEHGRSAAGFEWTYRTGHGPSWRQRGGDVHFGAACRAATHSPRGAQRSQGLRSRSFVRIWSLCLLLGNGGIGEE